MRVALFVPCYVDQLRPEVGVAALDVLEARGIEVEYPEAQTCCGQPFLTAGEAERAGSLAARFVEIFDGFDAIVALSGSCAATVRGRLTSFDSSSRAANVADRTLEFCEFLAQQAPDPGFWGSFPHRVGLHASCHGLRELRLGTPSESREAPRPDPARQLLTSIAGLELVALERPDDCCGFGGIFSIEEEAVSCSMGRDRLADHRSAGAEVIASTDVSCLLHLDALARKNGPGVRTMHVAEILAASRGASPHHERAEKTDGAR